MIERGKPITPDQLAEVTKKHLPHEVIEVFNELIAASFHGNEAIVDQDTAAKMIARKLGLTEKDVFSKYYLDVETVYEDAGWDVVYDSPAYNESYPATFKFRRK